MSETMNDWTNKLRAAKDAAQHLTGAAGALNERHGELTRERDRTDSQLQPVDEVVANMRRTVNVHRQRFDELQPSIVSAFSAQVVLSRQTNDFRRHPPTGHFLDGPLEFSTICGLVPSLVTARLEEIIRAAPSHVFGLPLPQRKQRIAELDAEIADVERQHTELVESAAEFGIELALLPAVRERRQDEERERRRQEELARQRKLAADANAAHGRSGQTIV